jgi:ribosome maturation factor RimP
MSKRGVSPFLFYMITKDEIEKIVLTATEGSDLFIVDINVNPGNAIEVLLDKDSGLTIDDCKKISRAIEGSYDREVEDFSLEVSSPGVGKPLKVKRQYLKNVGRTAVILTQNGEKLEGILSAADEEKVTVSFKKKETVPGKKTKQWVDYEKTLPYSEIKETKITISFK